MKKWKVIFYSLMLFLAGLLLIFIPSQNVSASEDFLVVFNFNSSSLSKNLMDSYRNLGLSTDYVELNGYASPDLTDRQANTLKNLKDYYTYEWLVDGVVVDIETYPITKNTTFVAKWTPIDYTVYFNYGDETIHTQDYNIESGRINYYRPTKEHYAFKDWCTTKQYNVWTVETYLPAGACVDMQLYAHWTPIEYRINYHTDVENKYNPISYNIENSDIKLLAISKEGYDFKGWFLDKDCTQSITTISSGSYGDINLYPLWQAKTYKVTYILPDGERQVVSCDYGKTAKLPNIEKNIFQIVKTDAPINNIKGDTTINITLHNIWYVYLLALLVLAGGVVAIVFVIKKNRENHSKLRYMYHSNNKKGF